LKKQEGAPDQRVTAEDSLAVKAKGRRLQRKLAKVRFEKLGLGSLMRIVRGRHYENLTDDLSEVALLRRRVPGIKRYYEHLH
jgi:hypothetical protein